MSLLRGSSVSASDVLFGVLFQSASLSKEEERLIRRISGGYPNGVPSAVSPEKRLSMQ